MLNKKLLPVLCVVTCITTKRQELHVDRHVRVVYLRKDPCDIDNILSHS